MAQHYTADKEQAKLRTSAVQCATLLDTTLTEHCTHCQLAWSGNWLLHSLRATPCSYCVKSAAAPGLCLIKCHAALAAAHNSELQQCLRVLVLPASQMSPAEARQHAHQPYLSTTQATLHILNNKASQDAELCLSSTV
jgi:hypothetical protein